MSLMHKSRYCNTYVLCGDLTYHRFADAIFLIRHFNIALCPQLSGALYGLLCSNQQLRSIWSFPRAAYSASNASKSFDGNQNKVCVHLSLTPREVWSRSRNETSTIDMPPRFGRLGCHLRCSGHHYPGHRNMSLSPSFLRSTISFLSWKLYCTITPSRICADCAAVTLNTRTDLSSLSESI